MTLNSMKSLGAVLMMLIGISPCAAAQTRILCLGDSLTEGYGINPEDAWPARLQILLAGKGHPDVEVINAGVSGSTSASGVSRLRWHLKANPGILILALGANDGLRGIDPEETRKNLSEVIALAKESGLKIILAGMKMPPNYGLVYKRRYDALYPQLAKNSKTVFMPFLLEDVAGDPGMNLADGIHPNAQGHQRMAESMLPYVLKLL